MLTSASEAVRPEERLRSLDAIFEAVPIGIVRVALDGRLIEANGEFVRIVGRDARVLMGHPWSEVVHPDDVQRCKDHVAGIATASSEGSVELRFQRADGTTCHTECRLAIVNPPSGGAASFVGYVLDVTSRQRAELAREEAHRVAATSERLASLGTLVAGVAHEINNPLMYIRGNVDIIRYAAEDALAAPDVDSARTALAPIERSTATAIEGLSRISTITKGLHQVVRQSAGERRDTDLNALVEAMLLVARPKLGNDTEVRASLQATTTASIEPNEIGQVILNLLFNAADVVRGASEGTITIRVSEDDDGHTIDVIDDGPGIPEADQTRIFTPFFTTKHTGTGLGLTVSHAIVRAHNGQLTFDTNPRTGTRFRVRIPRDITIPEESR